MAVIDQCDQALAVLADVDVEHSFEVDYLAWDETTQKASLPYVDKRSSAGSTPALHAGDSVATPALVNAPAARQRRRRQGQHRQPALSATQKTRRRSHLRRQRTRGLLPQTSRLTSTGKRATRRVSGIAEQFLVQKRLTVLPDTADSSLVMPIPVEPRVLRSNSAENISQGLTVTEPPPKKRLRSKVKLLVRESDAASANCTLLATWANALLANAAFLHWLCSCHQVNIVSGLAMCSVEGQSKVTINDLYCTANCL